MKVEFYAFEKLYDFKEGSWHTLNAEQINESICPDEVEITYFEGMEKKTIIIPKVYIHGVSFSA